MFIIGLETTGYETIHKILLTLTCHLGGATLHSAVVSLNQRDVCLKQSLLHPFLYRASLALEEIAIKTKLVEETVLSDIDAILCDELREVAYQDRIVASCHCISKQDFGFLRLEQLILLFDSSLHDVDCLAEDHLLVVLFADRNISARLSDLWQHLRSHPMLELASLRELAVKYQSIETTLIDEGCLLLATERVDGVAFCDVILHDVFANSITRVAIA